MRITKKLFGYTKENQPVLLYRLENSTGAYVEIINYGCRVHSIFVPDKTGTLQDVCLGYNTLAEYENDDAYFGAAIGRCANIIYDAKFSLNGKLYKLDKNNGDHHNHGGEKGFSFCVWDAEVSDNRLIFSHTFPDMYDGYPGNLNMQITYEWTENNQLNINYQGVSDQDTILNVTNHTYFNLNGANSSSVLNHKLWIDADKITEVDSNLIPTGEYISVEKTPFDFRKIKTIGDGINSTHYQIQYGMGYDHNFVLNGEGYRKSAILYSPTTKICVTCYTDQPGVQIYTANELTKRTGKYGETLSENSGICMETQHFANAINTPNFPTIELKKNNIFNSTTSYNFDILD